MRNNCFWGSVVGDEQIAALVRHYASPPAALGGSSTATALSPQQSDLWRAARSLVSTPVSLATVVFRLHGPVHRTPLAAAVRRLSLRHDLLRTVFENDPVPAAHLSEPPELRVVEAPDTAEEVVRGIARTPFRFGKEPLFRVTLVCHTEDDHLLVLTCHQLVIDGYGQNLLLREFTSLYRAEMRGGPDNLPKIKRSYLETARLLRNPDLEVRRGDEEFWTSRLRDLPVMSLPGDRPGPAGVTLAPTGTVETVLPDPDGAVVAGLRRLRVNLFALFAAGTMAMLHGYTGQTDLWVATVVDNRLTPESQTHVGPLAGPRVVRVGFAADATFGVLARAVQREVWATMERQHMPFYDVLTVATGDGADMRNLGSVGVTVSPPIQLPDWPLGAVEPLDFDPLEGEPSTGSPLALLVEKQAEGYRMRLEFDESRFSHGRARDMVTTIADAVVAAAADPQRSLAAWRVPTSAGG
ncbi:condensation domain-containing protein [Streptomyces sp. NPDC088348]|uniref:condensation domain-containing protein n=1 Tax=Streptomyces sp. NPDC088348 TaxID=3365853 RepID=UPI0038236E1F